MRCVEVKTPGNAGRSEGPSLFLIFQWLGPLDRPRRHNLTLENPSEKLTVVPSSAVVLSLGERLA